MTNQEIKYICNYYGISGYTINSDGSIDVDGNVKLTYEGFGRIPIKFNKVNGYFYCYGNQLTSLEGSPESVRGSFDCSSNNLTSLEGSPKEVCGAFYCSSNNLTSLKGIPEYIRGSLICSRNPLKSFEGYNDDYEKLYCDNKNGLILKTKRKKKLKLIESL